MNIDEGRVKATPNAHVCGKSGDRYILLTRIIYPSKFRICLTVVNLKCIHVSCQCNTFVIYNNLTFACFNWITNCIQELNKDLYGKLIGLRHC